MLSPSLGPLCAFLSSVTWSIGTVGYSRLSRQYNGFAVNFARALAALPLFALLALAQAGGISESLQAFGQLGLRHLGWFSLSMLASYGVGDLLFFASTRSLGVPGALAIASSYPIFTVLAGVALNGDAVSSRQFAGLGLSVTGVVLVILSGRTAPIAVEIQAGGTPGGAPAAAEVGTPASPLPHRLERLQTGVLLAFGTAICWGINGYSVSRGGVGLSIPVGNTLRMSLALAIIATLARVTAPKSDLLLPWAEFKRWGWLFALEGFGGSLFFLYGLSRSPLVIGTTLSSLAPAISMPVAVALGSERFSWTRALGVFGVILGVWLLVRRG